MPGYHWLPDPLQERLLEREARRDAARLRADVPGLERVPPGGRAGEGRETGARGGREGGSGEELAREHGRYLAVPGVTEVMAASLALSRFLLAWCEARRPRRVADLGSGFTSWLLRRWASDRPGEARVVSVDDHPGWLALSRSFVERQGLGTDDFRSWNDFRSGLERYDLVVWDLGDVRSRARRTLRVAERVAPGGALVVDDVQKARLWRQVRRARRRFGLTGYSLRGATLDRFGRYAWLGVRPGPVEGAGGSGGTETPSVRETGVTTEKDRGEEGA